MLDWFFLLLAGTAEIVWANALKATHGFTYIPAILLVIVAMGLSTIFLALAVRTISIGSAYAIWVGIGIAGTSILGIIIYHESLSAPRIGFIVLILISIVGLKMVEK